MKFDRQFIGRWIASVAVALAIAFVTPVFVHRNAFTRAVSEYARNPTVENGTIMERERAENDRIALITHLEAAGVLFLLVNLGWLLFAWRKGRS